MRILGINAFHGDASAALVKDGVLVAAIEEERLNRHKHCAGFPTLAVRAVLESAGVAPTELDHVAISRDPKANLHKKILFAVQKGPSLTKLVKDRLANVAKVRKIDDILASALGIETRAMRAKIPCRRASQVAHLERVLHLALRAGCVPLDRRLR